MTKTINYGYIIKLEKLWGLPITHKGVEAISGEHYKEFKKSTCDTNYVINEYWPSNASPIVDFKGRFLLSIEQSPETVCFTTEEAINKFRSLVKSRLEEVQKTITNQIELADKSVIGW